MINKKMSLIAVLVMVSLCATQTSFGRKETYQFQNSTTPYQFTSLMNHKTSCVKPGIEVLLVFAAKKNGIKCPSKSVKIGSGGKGTITSDTGKCTLKVINVGPCCQKPSANLEQYQSFDKNTLAKGVFSWQINGGFGVYSLKGQKRNGGK